MVYGGGIRLELLTDYLGCFTARGCPNGIPPSCPTPGSSPIPFLTHWELTSFIHLL